MTLSRRNPRNVAFIADILTSLNFIVYISAETVMADAD